MYQLTGYLSGYDEDIRRDDLDFLVTSCGHYRLVTQPCFETLRADGRRDYQLLFTAGGSILLEENGKKTSVETGTGLLFRPGEPQHYYYRLENAPDIYWMHFTGRNAGQLLSDAGFTGRMYRTGVKNEYIALFDRMIRELQLRCPGFSALCSALGIELLTALGRKNASPVKTPENEAMETVLARYHRDFQQDLRVEELARECGMSECWFIRSFRQRTGMTPQRYLTAVRLNHARELLESSSFNIGEIAALSGYENALYFSRIFRKYIGIAPSDYRKQAQESE